MKRTSKGVKQTDEDGISGLLTTLYESKNWRRPTFPDPNPGYAWSGMGHTLAVYTFASDRINFMYMAARQSRASFSSFFQGEWISRGFVTNSAYSMVVCVGGEEV